MAKRKSFEFYYKLCEDYYSEHGDLKIPEHYTVEVEGETIKLGMWIVNRRRRKETLSQDKIDQLEKLGMVWNVKSWYSFYELLKEYMKDNDIRYLKQVDSYKGASLGQWVYLQRCKYKTNSLSQEKIDLLEKIGFIWNTYSDSKNEEYIGLLQDYYKEKGHLLVSVNEDYKGVRLGKYVARLRSLYKSDLLDKASIEYLESLGFEWSGNDGFWKHCYNLCIACLNDGGKITTSTIYKGFKIGAWLDRQKIALAKGRLDETKKDAITKLLSSNPSNPWKEAYFIAREYYEENNTLDMKTPIYKCFELRKWLDQQRKLYADGKLTKEKIDYLDEIEMKW